MIEKDNMYMAPLSEYEENTLLPIMVECLKSKKGIDKATTNSFMCTRLKAHGYKVSSARIRKLINRIRTEHLIDCLIASSNGYYISDSIPEMVSYIESLQGREDAIRQVREALEEQLERLKKNIQIQQNETKVNIKSSDIQSELLN